MAGVGMRLCFHGAFALKKDAERKERIVRQRISNLRGCSNQAFILRRKIRGAMRWIVVTEKKA